VGNKAVAALAHGDVVLDGRGVGALGGFPKTVLIAGATGFGALGPLAVDAGSLAGVDAPVVCGLGEEGTLLAAVGRAGNDGADTADLILGARVWIPGGPLGDCTINRAGVFIAGFDVHKSTAGVATIGGELEDGATALHGPSAAGGGTLGERTPLADSTVDGTLALAALAKALDGGTGLATVEGGSADVTRAPLSARSTGLGTLGPVGPVVDLAVTGAGLRVAGNDVAHALTRLAAVEGAGNIITNANTVATTAGLSADTPWVPVAGLAVDGALVVVARLRLFEVAALDSEAFDAALGSSDDGAGSVLRATVALLRARAP
jgi:hypothetical protein